MLRNSQCDGWVVHRRGELAHEFRYRVWMLLADSALLAGEDRGRFGRSGGWSALQLRASDYLSVSGNVLGGVNAKLGEQQLPSCDRVFVLSQPRSWGGFFNPVVFYFCFTDERLSYVLSEINNTPWNEKHTYVMDARGQEDRDELRFDFPKNFHVSPFMPMDIDYRWRIRLQNDSIQIAIELQQDARELLFAGLYLKVHVAADERLGGGHGRYVLQSLRTLGRIYWQAARLFWKRSTFFEHPRLRSEAN